MKALQERDGSIDLLRCIALLGILLAHVSPPPFIIQLRGFDVPLMVFLSGVVFFRWEESSLNFRYLAHYWGHRIKRIIFPVWLFLFLYYPLMFFLSGEIPSLAGSGVLAVFTLQTGWYVWIFRVFLIVALVAPFLTIPTRGINVAILYLVGVAILLFFDWISSREDSGFPYYVAEAIPYMVVFLFGMLAKRVAKKWMILVTVAWVVVYVLLAVWMFKETGKYVNTSTCKYPPRLYYLAYGLGCIGFLWLIKDGLMRFLKKIPILEKLVLFMGSHSMWIYLWHILFLEFMGPFCSIASGVIRFIHLPFWAARFAFILILSCLLTFIQSRLITRWRSSHPDNPFLKWFYPILVG